jgi:protein-tyrosine phosphatase
LGVNEKTIMRDYLATNYFRTSENEKAISGMVKNYGMNEATARKMMEAKEKYLNTTFVSIKRQYGTVNHYLESVMGVDKKMLQKLRTLYLN